VATGILALVTVMLEERRRARDVRGIARLVSAESALLRDTIEKALKNGFWRFYWPLPHAAWDRGGRVIVTDLRDAQVVIDAFADVQTWERFSVRVSERGQFDLDDGDRELLEPLVKNLDDSRELLKPLDSPHRPPSEWPRTDGLFGSPSQ
jgi:hypothetical protein